MNALTKELMARIRAEGPISIADYMQECLLHPKYGYYSTRDPLVRREILLPPPKSARCLANFWAFAWRRPG